MHLIHEEEEQTKHQSDRDQRHQDRHEQVVLRRLNVVAVFDLASIGLLLQQLLQGEALASDVLRTLLGAIGERQGDGLVVINDQRLGDLILVNAVDGR